MATSTDTPTLDERYRTAIHTSNLGSDERTFRSDSDVLGAMGLGDKHLTSGWVTTGPDGEGFEIRACPLAVPLTRLLAGDHKVAHTIVAILAEMVWSRALVERIKPKISRPAAYDMAVACLAWHQHGTCRSCGGHGYDLIPGTKTHSERECRACHGTKRIPFEDGLDPDRRYPERREMGRWLLVEMERAMGRAGPAAMSAIAPRLDL
jgi:hypothetical protein